MTRSSRIRGINGGRMAPGRDSLYRQSIDTLVIGADAVGE